MLWKVLADYLINEFNVKSKKIFTGLQGFPKNQIKFDTKKLTIIKDTIQDLLFLLAILLKEKT